MEEGRPSATAERAAVMRALHQQFDDLPRILDDPVSLRLIDQNGEAYRWCLTLLAGLPSSTACRLRSAYILRSRFAEDCLVESFSEGVRQYVILGAGLDTFAYRQPTWADSILVFEVDHPATQLWKRRRLQDARVLPPANLRYVPVDFEKVSLAEAFSRGGVDFRIPTFFSMLAVSVYLSEAALEETLRLVLSAPAHSRLVFSFMPPDSVLPADDVALVREFVAQFAKIGEPWLSRFVPDQLSAKLSKMGFHNVFHLSPEHANLRYFSNRRDGLSAPLLEQMISATVS